MIAGFLVELDLRDVTLVCNDWGGAQLVVAPGGSDRVGSLVLVSCEAFDNYPPGIPGRLLCLNASLPGGTFLTAQLLRPRLIRHLPFTCGALTNKRLPNDQFMSLIEPLRHNPRVRRDLDKYLRSVPAKVHLGTCIITSVQRLDLAALWREHGPGSALQYHEFQKYFEGVDVGTALTLTQPRAFSRRIPLQDLRARPEGFRPPQSFAYVDAKTGDQLIRMAA